MTEKLVRCAGTRRTSALSPRFWGSWRAVPIWTVLALFLFASTTPVGATGLADRPPAPWTTLAPHPARGLAHAPFYPRATPTNVLASPSWSYAAAGEPEFTVNRFGALSATWEDQQVPGNPLGPVGMALSQDSGASFGNSFAVGPYISSGFEFDVAQTAHSPNGTMWFAYGGDSGAGDNTYTTVIWNNGTHLSAPEVAVPASSTGNNFLDRDWALSTPNGTEATVVDSCPGNVCPNIYEAPYWSGRSSYGPVTLTYSNGDTTASADALNDRQWLIGDQATPSNPGVCQLIFTNDSGNTWQAASAVPTGCGSITWQMVWAQGPAVDIAFLNSAGTALEFSQTFNFGHSWTAPVTLSGSPPGGTSFQTPTIAADPATGETAVFWLDTRANPGGNQWNVFERDSPDNGVTWTPIQQVSSAVVGTGASFWTGDWIWSQLTPWGTAGVVWGDDRTGKLLTEFAQLPYEDKNDGNLTVTVVDAASNPVANAFVGVAGLGGQTSSSGTITYYNLVPGTLFCTGYKAGVGNGFANASVTAGTTSAVTIHLSGVPPGLSASASASPTVGRAPLTASFSGAGAGGSPPYTFAWRFGDGGSSMNQNPSHTFATPGNYTASLFVNDSAAGSARAQASVAVWNPWTPVTVSVTANPTSVVLGNALQLTAYAFGGTGTYPTFAWSSLPTGCSPASSSSFVCTPTAVGHWNSTATATDSAGNSGSGSAQVNVYNPAPPPLTVSLSASPRSFALGGTTTLASSASGGTPPYPAYTWSALPTGCSGANQATLSCAPSAAGHFNTTVTVHDSGSATASSTAEVDVWQVPTTLSVSLSASPVSFPLGTALTLTATPSGGSPPYAFAWGSLPTGCASANTAALSCTPSAAGHFNATTTVSDAASGQASATVQVNIWRSSSAAVAVTLVANPSTLSLGGSTTLTATASGGTGSYTTYAWASLPTGCATQNTASLACTPSAAGHFNATVVVTDGGGHSGTGKAEVDVVPAPSSSPPSSSNGGLWSGGPLGVGTMGSILIAGVVIAAVIGGLLLATRRRKTPPTPGPFEPGSIYPTGPAPPAWSPPEPPPGPPP